MLSSLELTEIVIDNRDTVRREPVSSPEIEYRASSGSSRGSLCFGLLYHQPAKILDPKDNFVHRWNKIILISCVLALGCDPLFFYVPVIDGKKKCIKLDDSLKIISSIFRTCMDLCYLLHIILQFYIGFVSPSCRAFGGTTLIKDHAAIAKRYLSSYFIIDLLAILPLPQLAVYDIIPNLADGSLTPEGLLKLVIFTQYVPRAIRIFPLYKYFQRTSGMITDTVWAGAAFYLFLYMLASHVVGASWYLFAIDRQGRCWRKSCMGHGCDHMFSFCKDESGVNYAFNSSYCSLEDPNQIIGSTFFNYGLFYDALRSEVVQSTHTLPKLSYCFWWGLRSLSSCGQNLNTSSTYFGENLFATLICVAGLSLFALLIGNMQKYLQMMLSIGGLEEDRRQKKQAVEQWMSRRLLPVNLKERIRRHHEYVWQETRGVSEESVIDSLPRDLRMDIKRHLGLDLVMGVPMFAKLDEKLKDAMFDHLKPVLYTKNSYIVREGDPVNEMLFIMRGSLLSMSTNGGITGFFDSVSLKAGDFCGEELLTWALDPHSFSSLPISTRTVLSETEVEAFALMPDDLKFVASQFRRLHSKQVQHTFRFYSPLWRTWAACFIQAAWRRYYRRKLERSLPEAEEYALAKEGGSSLSFSVAMYASRFASNALRNLRRSTAGYNKIPSSSPLLYLPKPKPDEPDFASI
ncbi:cyclic nucleotide-gated ion channel 1-like [Chenopodium quinoa]|uniref:cyclic nucleotide-gated ion channel 1-like n=1 Tax=Chenopodium quinoa TaxID=63459 RepID=UPI000B77D46B|nr:cyclic nucleotide-gated ion channel 1-like [Chenopodium quinoa]XP_021760310.1 cyclic nucleotide-gated ion channel 1-like [Chenopodium quinoa]XP_021760311.1 cyclic nucleotide-gated ion channel 1-like [Chenopodium quinoa]XP_021760312.1 cyclic nucleotide-gated ion channel 1-like [Chenopodium quinoa]XP_021760313.1 cyclic nucleotide-gated ion channel 1-like [Chenopodium quinoa]XP_021760314.1 cyclic nucleotide-gated ion channel 1-like [Chenopodium quinoa]